MWLIMPLHRANRATHTMHYLSEGWGHGTGLAAVVSWSLALSKFIKVVECVPFGAARVLESTFAAFLDLTFFGCRLIRMEDASQAVAEEYRGTTFGVLWAYVRAGGPMVLALLAPLIIASDVAQVSSMCDRC
eukprot:SAG22_NODE_1023_length_5990_cov_16.923782_3_plen_132_part_00